MRIYLARDPETGRISAMPWPFLYPKDFPRGLRGEGWEMRDLDVPQGTWTKLDRGTYSSHAQDDIHQRWWNEAEVTGEMTPISPPREQL